jgi:hypothetical protein
VAVSTYETFAGSSFENVKAFLAYVQGAPSGVRGVPSGIVRDLQEMEERAKRVRAMTGLMEPVEFSPYVRELIEATASSEAGSEGVLNRAGA